MALKRLRKLFPRDMHEWEKMIDWRSELISFFGQPTSKGFAFDVVNAAYQEDSEIPSILPAAFLFLYMKHGLVCPEPLTYDLVLDLFVNLKEEIMLGVKRFDQSLATLQPQAMLAALSGRASFMNSWIRQFRRHLEFDEEYRFRITYKIPDPSFTQEQSCTWGLANVLGQLTSKAVDIHPICIPLRMQDICYVGCMPEPEISLPDPFCDFCTAVLRDCFHKTQEDWWKSLPGSFLLPPWGRMQDFDM